MSQSAQYSTEGKVLEAKIIESSLIMSMILNLTQ